MATHSATPFLHVHADQLKCIDGCHPLIPICEPEADDAAASPVLFEALEAQLWRGQPDAAADGADLMDRADVAEVLHPVAGIELDG